MRWLLVTVGVALATQPLPSAINPTEEAVARADEIILLSADVFTGVIDVVVADFERITGHKVTIRYGTAGAMRSRVQSGEVADVTILPRPMLDDLLRQGRIRGSIIDVARSAVGVAVRRGGAKPDISTVEAFARALREARSIAYPDPKRGGATGVLFTRVLERLRMTAEMEPKTRFPGAGEFPVHLVARGQAELAISQPMEVLTHAGVELVGLLPVDLQDPAEFCLFDRCSCRGNGNANGKCPDRLSVGTGRSLRAKDERDGSELKPLTRFNCRHGS